MGLLEIDLPLILMMRDKLAKKMRLPIERWEIALVEAMRARGGYSDQEILAYFTIRQKSAVHHQILDRLFENGCRRGAIQNKPEGQRQTLIVVDDICTQGYSLEAARAFAEAADVNVICRSFVAKRGATCLLRRKGGPLTKWLLRQKSPPTGMQVYLI